jgi:signal peptidase I
MAEKEKTSLKDFLLTVAISIVVVFLVRTFIAQPFVVSGASMEPTFHNGEYLIVDQLSYRLSEPERGDVIVFKYPLIPSRFFIKRIIAMPGETIKIEGEEVFIKTIDSDEFRKLNEGYIEFPKDSFEETTLEDNEYFVMGDNRLASLDSRVWGPLKEEYIVGKAFVRLFPFDKMCLVPGNK